MGWTINNKTPEELGVTVAGWTDQTLNASVLTLDVAQKDYTATAPATLAYNTPVTLKLDGNQIFKGKCRNNPRSATGESEGVSYTILDAFDELDRTVYQELKTFAVSVASTDDYQVVTTEDFIVGSVQFEVTELLGDRVKQVLQYAISVGVDIALGEIDSGIKWFRSSYEDTMCGDLIRDIMRLMPEYVFWLDNTQNPPQANLKLRSAMPSLSYDINAGNVIAGHDITELESEQVRGVVIKYEIPVSVEGESYTFPIIDSDGETEGVDVVVRTIALDGANFNAEYHRPTTAPIPQADADPDDQLKWWISQMPELADIADEHGLDAMVSFLNIADADNADASIKKHTIKVVDDGIDRPDPINPRDALLPMPDVEHSEDAKMYPNQLIEGTLPGWANKRNRIVRASATIGIKVSEYENIQDKGLKARFKELFGLPKSFGEEDYLTANFLGEVMGTNAVTKNYSRITAFDQNEPVPTGIAAQMRDQYNQRRFSGSLQLVNMEVEDVGTLGMGLNFTNGESAWSTMNEAIQSVSYDVETGQTNISYGTSEQLGINDLRERLRAAKINDYSHNLRSGKKVTEGVGGTAVSPVSKFSIISGGSGGEVAPHPWQVTVKKSAEPGEYKAQVNADSLVFKSLTNTDKYELNLSESVTVTGADYLVLEYDASKAGMDDSISIKAVPKDGYEAIVTETTDGTTTHLFSRVVLASFETSDGDANGAANGTANETPIGSLRVKDQVARNHFYQTFICTFGGRFAYFKPL